MSYFVFLLSLLLLAAGLASGYFSVDLLPTGMGMLYALAGAIGVTMALLAFSIGVLIRRVDKIAAIVRNPQPIFPHPAPLPVPTPPESMRALEPEAAPAPIPEGDESAILAAPAGPELSEPGEETLPEAEDQEPINENRSGHLPTLAQIEHAIETPETPPALIGRYSSGGTHYMIFSDGSIEAETTDGTYKFDSMGDFKQYLAERRGAKG